MPRGRSAAPIGSCRAPARGRRSDLDDPRWPSDRTGDLAVQPHRANFDLERFRPFEESELGRAGDERAAWRGAVGRRSWRAAGLLVVRDGRVVHHEIDPGLEAKGVRVCDIATCDGDDVRELVGAASCSSQDAFTVLHDAFLVGGALVRIPDGVVVDDPLILVLRWCERRSACFPHTSSRSANAPKRPCLTASAHLTPPSGRRRHRALRRRRRPCAIRVDAAARDDDLARRTAAGPVGRNAIAARSSAVALGGDYARMRSEIAAHRRPAGRATCSPSTSATVDQILDFRTLQDHARPTPAATCCSRARSRTTPGRCTRVSCACARRRSTPTRSQTNRNLVLTEGASAESIPNLEIEANDVRCSHASAVGPIDDDQRYYLETSGHPARRGRAAHRPRLLRRRARPPARAQPRRRSLRRSVERKLGRLRG